MNRNELAHLASLARAGGPHATRAAARLMTTMTDRPERLGELLAGSRDWPEPRLVLGVTGSPGCGKSTLTDHLVSEWRRRDSQRRIGIVAVDPSSPFTGGAVLGDRVRMMRHATDPKVFIRSLASRGHLGGLALGTKGIVRVMGLIGCDVVVIETVGVGQSEVEIARCADLVMIVLAPGQGDSIQMLKAGLMEAGELFVVNKADRDGAFQLHQQLLATLSLARPIVSHADAAIAPAAGERVFLCSAAQHEGIAALVDAIEQRAAANAARWRAARSRQVVDEVRDAALELLRCRFVAALGDARQAESEVRRVLAGELTLDELRDELIQRCARRLDGA